MRITGPLRISGGRTANTPYSRTVTWGWPDNGGYGSFKVTGDGTNGYLAFINDNQTIANTISVGDRIVISQGGDYPSANVIGAYDTFSEAVISNPILDWNGIKGFMLDNSFGLVDFQADRNVDSFVVSQQDSGSTVTKGVRFSFGSTPSTTFFTPTGTPSYTFDTLSSFEMGPWSSGDAGTVPDMSSQNHSFGLNDNTSGSTNYYHFYNNSAQANNSDWPVDNVSSLTIMGWFVFASFGGSTSLVTRTEGSNGWALRVDGSGSTINLVKYNDADQTTTLDTPLTTNTWHFISVSQIGDAVTYNIDGTLYGVTGSPSPFASSGGPVRLQYDPCTGGNQNVEMWMREIKILETALTAEAIMTYYNTSKSNYGY